MSLFGVPRTTISHQTLHPEVSDLIRQCPTRLDVLRAASGYALLPPEKEEVIFQNSYALFIKLNNGLPQNYRARGGIIESAFRPLLNNAHTALENLPHKQIVATVADAQCLIEAYVKVHWALGARAAAMDLYCAVE